MATEDPRLPVEVSRLYWESDASVSEIADELGLSRRALYEALVPVLAGGSCLECGGELVYVNRSNRAAARAECRVCGREEKMEPIGPSAGAGASAETNAPAPLLEPNPESEMEWDAGPMAPIDVVAAAERRQTLLIVAAAFAGAAIGAAVTVWVGGDRR